MSTALTVPVNNSLARGSQSFLEKMSKGSGYLRNLRLYASGTEACNAGLIRPGSYGVYVSDTEINEIGREVVLLPLAYRPFAIDFGTSPPTKSYDDTSETYKGIEARADAGIKKNKYGPELLVVEQESGELLEYFLGTISERNIFKHLLPFFAVLAKDTAGTDVKPRPARPFMLRSKLKKGKESDYWVPELIEFTGAFTSRPDDAAVDEALTKFLNPPIPEAAPESTRRR